MSPASVLTPTSNPRLHELSAAHPAIMYTFNIVPDGEESSISSKTSKGELNEESDVSLVNSIG
eukprot:2752236-Ditylum_brightwellii.AAC.1